MECRKRRKLKKQTTRNQTGNINKNWDLTCSSVLQNSSLYTFLFWLTMPFSIHKLFKCSYQLGFSLVIFCHLMELLTVFIMTYLKSNLKSILIFNWFQIPFDILFRCWFSNVSWNLLLSVMIIYLSSNIYIYTIRNPFSHQMPPRFLFTHVVLHGKLLQLYPTLCDPVDHSPPGSSVHGILQARILEWVAIPFQGIIPTQGSNPGPPALQADSTPSEPLGST